MTRETSEFVEETKIVRRIAVDVTTVAELIDRHALGTAPGSIFVKIDTQGSEQGIIQGARRRLEMIAGFQMELSFKRIYEDAWRFDQAIAEMADLGFEIAALYPNTPTHFPLLIEMDGIFRNIAVPVNGERGAGAV